MKIAIATLALAVASADAKSIFEGMSMSQPAASEASSESAWKSAESAEAYDSKMSAKSSKGSYAKGVDSCPAAFAGKYSYMATVGQNAGKSYTMINSYDPKSEKLEGIFTLFADALGSGAINSYIPFYPDDSVFARIDVGDFEIDEHGLCALKPVALSCPLAQGSNLNSVPQGSNETLLEICDKYFGNGTCDGSGNVGVEANIPLCGYTFSATQIDGETWSLVFPEFDGPTAASRFAVVN